jgi:hypothetical protein
MTWNRRALVVALVSGFVTFSVVACGGQAEAQPRFCKPETDLPGCTSAQIGVEYDHSLSTHCGIVGTYFDGRLWIVEPKRPYSGSNYLTGTMQLVTTNAAQFTVGIGGRQIAFEPAPSGFTPPPCY